MRGRSSGAASPIAYALLERLARPGEPLRRVGVQREQRLTRPYPCAGLGVQHDPGARLHRMLLAGPAGSEPPGGLADTASASSDCSTPSCSAVITSVSRAVGSAASGSPPCALIMARQTSIAAPEASRSAGS